ncbi:MAG: aldolase [Oscillospiraceae bacterium]|nr:aldolase [Oscillospiraceae bacterium]
MPLELMYITNRPDVALIAEEAGIDRVFVDMEYIGKDLRQGGMDTVQSHHTVEDVKNLRGVLKNTKLLVRVNPIHGAYNDCVSTESEIDSIIESGADVVMLPYFKTAREAERFITAVDGRARTCLLVETAEAAENLDDILSVGGIDEIHIGLNDLHLAYKMKFLFELLADGTVEALCRKIRNKGISYGFGGVARVGTGTLPAECILGEHYRLGSDRIILSRAFCDVSKEKDIDSVREKLCSGVADLRQFEKTLKSWSQSDYEENCKRLCDCVKKIVSMMNAPKG